MSWTAPEVSRPREPYLGDDRAILVGYLEFHRATLLSKCAGLTGEQLARRAVPPSSLSLLGLIRHMADVEIAWFLRRVAGQDVPFHFFFTDPSDEDIEFTGATAETAEHDYGLLVDAMDRARVALAKFPLDHIFEHPDRGTMSTRWALTHMVEEYARHNGHADFLREQIDGATGE